MRLQPRAKMGGGSEARSTWLASRLAQGQVGRGAAALASLALLGSYLLVLLVSEEERPDNQHEVEGVKGRQRG